MFYLSHPPGEVAWEVISDYTFLSESTDRTMQEQLEEDFVLDFLVTVAPAKRATHCSFG